VIPAPASLYQLGQIDSRARANVALRHGPALLSMETSGRCSRGAPSEPDRSIESFIASPGLDPGVYVFIPRCLNEKTWTAGSSPAEGIEGTIPAGRIVL